MILTYTFITKNLMKEDSKMSRTSPNIIFTLRTSSLVRHSPDTRHTSGHEYRNVIGNQQTYKEDPFQTTYFLPGSDLVNKGILLEWDNKYNAMKRTKEHYWKTYRKWRDENKGDYHNTFMGKLYDEFITLEERAIYLKYSFNTTEAVVFCSINIFYVEELIGTYDIEFFLNGEIADEYLDFGDVLLKDRITKVKHNLKIARSALKLGFEASDISKIIEIPLEHIEILKKKYS